MRWTSFMSNLHCYALGIGISQMNALISSIGAFLVALRSEHALESLISCGFNIRCLADTLGYRSCTCRKTGVPGGSMRQHPEHQLLGEILKAHPSFRPLFFSFDSVVQFHAMFQCIPPAAGTLVMTAKGYGKGNLSIMDTDSRQSPRR